MRQFTAVAGKATQFAAVFNAAFIAGFEGPIPYRVDLTTPVGPSTAGGKQALQHLRLAPRGGGPAIVIGSANPNEMTAEIRTFRHLAELHAQRFKGARVPVDANAYRDLTRRLAQFFAAQGFSVVMVDLTDTPMSSRPPPPPRVHASETPWIVAGMAIAFALGLGLLAVLLGTRAAGRAPEKPAATAPAPAAS